MNFATWSLRNPKPAILLFALLCLAGLYGLVQLHVQYVPDLQLPTVNIELSQAGAAPAQLETDVARKVEDALSNLQGIKHIETTIVDGAVRVGVKYEIGKNRSDALIEVKDAVDRIRAQLPAALDPPRVSAPFAFDDPVLTYAVSSHRLDESALSWFVDETIAKTLSGLKGVGRVKRIGGSNREVRVEVDPTQMAALGVTTSDVSQALRSTQQQSSGGHGQVGAGEQAMRVLATVRQAQDLRDLPIVLPDGRSVRLDQVATVRDTDADRTEAALLDGHPVVGFSIYRALGQDELALEAGVRKSLSDLTVANPGLVITTVANKVDYTHEQYRGSMDMLFEGAALAVLVVWWFLRDWRATLVAASALPLSIIPVFAAMHWLGFSLNTLTLLALAAVVGILVDDAIVEIENIVRHVQSGKPVREATADAVNEIGLAVIATTLTLAAVFVPTSMMNSVPGLFFREFGWTAALAVLASLLVARLLTPMMAARWLRPHLDRDIVEARTMTYYLRAVRWCLDHRTTTLVAALLFFVGSIALVPFLSTGLLPSADTGYINVGVELPPGSSLADTLAATEISRAAVITVPGIAHVLATVGQGNRDAAGDVRRGSLTVVLAPHDQRGKKSSIESEVRRALVRVPGARFSFSSGNDDESLEMILASDNDNALAESATALERDLRSIPGLANVATSASLERPEIVVRPDAARAAQLGVSAEAMGEAVRIATSGDFDARLSKLQLDARQIPVSVRISEEPRGDLQALGNLRIPGRGVLVPISSVASLSLESGPAQIERFDRRRYIRVTASLGAMPLGDASAAARALPAAQHLPPGVTLSDSGNAENMKALLSGFGIAMAAGVLCVYCVLVLLFRDFVQPLTILSALPLSLGGAFVALLVTRGQLNIPSLIGMVMLMGVVTKNSILLVEYALAAMRDRGLNRRQALLDACHKRARPILMTTVAMTSGLLPIALGLGADASFRQPMAIAVIGGLITSTGLSLLVVPVVFSLLAPRPAAASLEALSAVSRE